MGKPYLSMDVYILVGMSVCGQISTHVHAGVSLHMYFTAHTHTHTRVLLTLVASLTSLCSV